MWFSREGEVLTRNDKAELVARLVEEAKKRICPNPKRVCLLPPDKTRYHSGAGELTNMLHKHFPAAKIDVIPTLGQHVPHTPEENRWMFGDIPEENIYAHDWINTVKRVGEVGSEYVSFTSEGAADWPIPVEVNSRLFTENYDLIINVGQVVPHEVLGFANHNKNYFIGLAGKGMICGSHMMAGACGIENNLGQYLTPLRACYNKAERECLGALPDVYLQVVMTRDAAGELVNTGFYVGDDISPYLAAARYSCQHSITMFDEPLKKVVTVMDEREYNSTWVSNKAVYRTRMAMADGGELIVIAPGVERFGEQQEVDDLIRKYGYKGTEYVRGLYKTNKDLQDLGHAAAHLLHGSSEGRFTITYSTPKLTKEEIEGVGFNYLPYDEALKRYNPEKLKDGYNTVEGEDVFFISSPAMGLWAAKTKYVEAKRKNLSLLKRLAEREPAEESHKTILSWIEKDLA